MRIASILHKAGGSIDSLFEKIERGAKTANIVIAPDYALAIDMNRPNSMEEYDSRTRKIMQISKEHNSLIIPGTMPVSDGKEMRLVCPVYRNGIPVFQNGTSNLIQKQRSCGEEELAKKYGLEYKRGTAENNYFHYDNLGSIAVEICSDHGKQKIPDDTFLEIILAYDSRAGFYHGILTPKFKRKIIVCDAFAPKIIGHYFDENKKFKDWDPTKESAKAEDIVYHENL